jgi:hypothetical protein
MTGCSSACPIRASAPHEDLYKHFGITPTPSSPRSASG